MKPGTVRIFIAILTGFVALTAIAGGTAILIGADQFPLEWLPETPFTSYTIPALILAIAVGGSALVATVLLFAAPRSGIYAAMVAGMILTGYVVVEVLILKQVPPGPTPIELFYIAIGFITTGLAFSLRKFERQLISSDPE